MLEAMLRAEVGDDVFGEDPTVNRLQEKVAKMFGKEAGLFVPSGVMGNEVCIKTHTEPGDEIIVDQDSHIFVYETASPSLLSGVQMKPLQSKNGLITLEQIQSAIRPSVYYMPKTKLICLENTHGRTGGTIFPFEEMKRIKKYAEQASIPVHLDGARIWNASIASGISLNEYGRCADSISVCFSKGLGAPVGSMILGTKDFIERARKFRKIFGGGMRQVGVLAAAAEYALENNLQQLNNDHAKASLVANELSKIKSFKIDVSNAQTNMVMVDVEGTRKSQSEVLNILQENGILCTPERSTWIRVVTHLDVSLEEVKQAIKVFQSLFT
jgi:threonine aldolase